MANEVEVERLVVRVMGDVTDLRQKYQQILQMTKDAGQSVVNVGKTVEQNFNPAERSVKSLGLSVHESRKAFHLLAMSSVIPPEVATSAIQLGMAYGLVTSTVGKATVGMSALKIALVGTGVGIAAVGLGIAVGWLTKMHQEATKAREAATSAFNSMASGTKLASQAISEMRIDVLNKGLSELTETIASAPGLQRGWNNLLFLAGFDAAQVKLDVVIARARAADATFRLINADPRAQALQQEVASRTLVQGMTEQARALTIQAVASGMSERATEQRVAQERLALAIQRPNELMADALNRAMGRLRGSFDDLNAANRNLDFGKLVLQLQDLTREGDRAGMTEVGGRLTAMAQQFSRDNPGVTLQQAFRTLRPVLEATANQLNRISMSNFLRDLRIQGATMGMSSERAKLFEMSMNGVSDANIMAAQSEVKHLEALKALQAGLEDIQGTRFGSTEALAKIAQYNNMFAAATQSATIRQRLMEAGNTGLQSPAGSGVLAGSTGAGAAGARQQQQQAVMNMPAAALGPVPQLLQNIANLLQNMRDNANPINAPQQLVAAVP